MANYNGNYHSSTNQRILGKLVDREVLMCGTDIVEYSLRNCYETEDAPFTYDDIENNYRKVCPECGCELEEIEENEIEVIHKFQCVCCGENFDTYEEAQKCCYDEEDEDTSIEDYEVKEIWICPFCEDEHETEDEARDCICHYEETLYKCTGYNCDKYVLESEANEEANDAYEWWFVTGWLAEKLAQHGEMVIQGWHNVWGRGCSGQAISMDWVIAQIAIEMGILEGMENDWSEWMDK